MDMRKTNFYNVSFKVDVVRFCIKVIQFLCHDGFCCLYGHVDRSTRLSY